MHPAAASLQYHPVKELRNQTVELLAGSLPWIPPSCSSVSRTRTACGGLAVEPRDTQSCLALSSSLLQKPFDTDGKERYRRWTR